VGPEALPEEDKLLLEMARIIREDFLQQSALNPVDAYSPPEKGVIMMEAIMEFYRLAQEVLSKGVPVARIRELKSRYMLSRMKFYTLDDLKNRFIPELLDTMRKEFSALLGG